MSDTEDYPELDITALKARDSRFQVLAESIAIEADLRQNTTIRALMTAVRDDAEQAMRDIAQVSPADQQRIAQCLVQINTLVYIRDVMDKLMKRGSMAEQAIRAEDEIE